VSQRWDGEGKGGRTQGVVNWSDEDFTMLLDVVEAVR